MGRLHQDPVTHSFCSDQEVWLQEIMAGWEGFRPIIPLSGVFMRDFANQTKIESFLAIKMFIYFTI
jgi:hypothetical protein